MVVELDVLDQLAGEEEGIGMGHAVVTDMATGNIRPVRQSSQFKAIVDRHLIAHEQRLRKARRE